MKNHHKNTIAEALMAQARSLELVARALLSDPPDAAPPVAEYTSARRGPHPPGKSQDWTVRHLKSIPGAYKAGRDWCITAEDYRAWAANRAVAKELAKSQPDIADLVSAAIATKKKVA